MEELKLGQSQPTGNFDWRALAEWRHCLKRRVMILAREGKLGMHTDWAEHLTVLCDADAVILVGDDPRADEMGDLQGIIEGISDPGNLGKWK